MRHAKSSWAIAGMDDHDRPLNKRGISDTPLMGRMLVNQKLVPQRLLHSSAKRTTMTAGILAQQFVGVEAVGGGSFSENAVLEVDDLYHAPWTTYIQLLSGLAGVDHALDSVMLLGHNPGIEVLIEKLTGRFETIPTATIAWLEMASDSWGDSTSLVETGGYKLMDLWRPREI